MKIFVIIVLIAIAAIVHSSYSSKYSSSENGVSSLILEPTAKCELFWDQQSESKSSGKKVSYQDYVNTTNSLNTSDIKIFEWALTNLKHPYCGARETCAWVVGESCKNGIVAKEKLPQVVAELSVVANKPVTSDSKEIQANGSAVTALGKINQSESIEVLKAIILSDQAHHKEIHWNVVEALDNLTGSAFVKSKDPVAVAKQWAKKD